MLTFYLNICNEQNLQVKEEYKSKLMSTAAVEKESGNSKSIPTTIYLNKDKDKIRSIINSYL